MRQLRTSRGFGKERLAARLREIDDRCPGWENLAEVMAANEFVKSHRSAPNVLIWSSHARGVVDQLVKRNLGRAEDLIRDACQAALRDCAEGYPIGEGVMGEVYDFLYPSEGVGARPEGFPEGVRGFLEGLGTRLDLFSVLLTRDALSRRSIPPELLAETEFVQQYPGCHHTRVATLYLTSKDTEVLDRLDPLDRGLVEEFVCLHDADFQPKRYRRAS